jgi:hypothetical protein
MRRPRQILIGHTVWASPKSLTVAPRPGDASVNAFSNPFPLELREGCENVKLELSSRRGAVDALAQADERHADAVQVFQHNHEMPQIPPEPIESPAHQHVEPSALGVGQELVERGATILRPAHTVVNVFDGGPATRLDLAPQLGQLVLRLLVERAHTSVDGRLHATTLPSVVADVPAFRI